MVKSNSEVAFCHRTGQVKVREVGLVIAVAAPRRHGTFAACQYAGATGLLKEVVPVWKKEAWARSEVCVDYHKPEERTDGER